MNDDKEIKRSVELWEWILIFILFSTALIGLPLIQAHENKKEKECIEKGGIKTRFDGCIQGKRIQVGVKNEN